MTILLFTFRFEKKKNQILFFNQRLLQIDLMMHFCLRKLQLLDLHFVRLLILCVKTEQMTST